MSTTDYLRKLADDIDDGRIVVTGFSLDRLAVELPADGGFRRFEPSSHMTYSVTFRQPVGDELVAA